MSKILSTLSLLLAVNFLAVAGGVGWLYSSGHLDRERIAAIKEIVFPKPVDMPTTQPVADGATTRPVSPLDSLLAKYTGFPSEQKLEQAQHAFDAQMAQLERRQEELAGQQLTIEQARQQLLNDRQKLADELQTLSARQDEAAKLADDKGFQDSLTLYQSMPGKQAKAVFMGLDDATVIRYLQAMPPRGASRIIKEFKSPEEISRMQRLMEQMRQADAAAPAASTVSTEGP